MEFGLGSAMFGISGVNFFHFPGVQNNAFAYKLDLDQTRMTSGGRLEFGCPHVDFITRELSSPSTGRRRGLDGCGSGEPASVVCVGLGRDGTVPSRFGCLAVWNDCYGQPGVNTNSRAGDQHGVSRQKWYRGPPSDSNETRCQQVTKFY